MNPDKQRDEAEKLLFGCIFAAILTVGTLIYLAAVIFN